MSEVITSRDALFSKRPPMIHVELKDMGCTVCVLKGTWSTLKEIQALGESREEIPNQLALLLCDEQGSRLVETPEDIARLGAVMSLDDMAHVMKTWQEANGITEEAAEAAEKNSGPSLTAVSA